MLFQWKANLCAFINWYCSQSKQSWQSKARMAFERKMVPMGPTGEFSEDPPCTFWNQPSLCIICYYNANTAGAQVTSLFSVGFMYTVMHALHRPAFQIAGHSTGPLSDCTATRSCPGPSHWFICVTQPEGDLPSCLFLPEHIGSKIRHYNMFHFLCGDETANL